MTMSLENPFKQALKEGRQQIGLWVAMTSPLAIEAMAGTGFDWLLIDGEHAPNDLATTLSQLQAVAPYSTHPIVRPVIGDVPLIKQLCEIGAQTLLVPMVETADQAALMVAAMRYPPNGVRGVGASLARSSRWNRIPNYMQQSDAQMCVLVQCESLEGIANLDAIARTEGVDGVFFGAADLAASMGFPGEPAHPEVQRAILAGFATVRAAGKAPGALTTDLKQAHQYLDAGALFVAVGVDMLLLTSASRRLVKEFERETPVPWGIF